MANKAQDGESLPKLQLPEILADAAPTAACKHSVWVVSWEIHIWCDASHASLIYIYISVYVYIYIFIYSFIYSFIYLTRERDVEI